MTLLPKGFSLLIIMRIVRFLLNPVPLLAIAAIVALFWRLDPAEWAAVGVGAAALAVIAQIFFPFSYRDPAGPGIRFPSWKRSLWVRQLDTGSCNAEELEIAALENPVYDVQRIGVKIKSSPRHADAILMTGPLTRNLKRAAQRTLLASPGAKHAAQRNLLSLPVAKIIRVGDAGGDESIFKGSYALVRRDDLDDDDPLKKFFSSKRIPGNPPRPQEMLKHLADIMAKWEQY
jgi:membrane-bound hydrogenase subunit mbhJ